MTMHPCDLCRCSDHQPIEAARSFIGKNQEPPVVCMNCGFVYVRDRRGPAEIAKAWDAIWGEGYTSAWPMVKARLTYVAEFMKQSITGDHLALLDIGAGEGDFMKIVNGPKFLPFGLEPSKGNVDKINAGGCPCEHGTIEGFSPGRQYDVVTLLWTLENTGDCMGVLRKARELLKSGGRLVVATGSRILVPYKKPMSTYFSRNPQDLHCFRFSATSLRTALERAGFDHVLLNRYEDGDWLIAVGRAEGRISEDKFETDDPKKVLQFFDNWSKAFP